jgi:tRNA nucleotidyltransferase/poly(A) polymerase
LRAIAANRDGLAGLSRERIRAEFLKLLAARHAPAAIDIMGGLGLVLPILGGVTMPLRLSAVIDIETARPLHDADAILRLAALAVIAREDAERLRQLLRLSNAEFARLADAADAHAHLHDRKTPPGADELRKLLYRHGVQTAGDAIDLAHAESGRAANDELWRTARRFVGEAAIPRFPVNGAALVAEGIGPGRAVGETLKVIEAAWIEAGFPQSPEAVASLIRTILDARSTAG